MSHDLEKLLAARAAALLPQNGMRVGLGTGSTVAFLLPALAERELDIVCVATSPATEGAALVLGLQVRPFGEIDRLDIAIDGADQVSADGWLVKGGGGAHTREKVVAGAAEGFFVIVAENKLVGRIEAPVPLELLEFGIAATVRALGDVRLREVPRSPDGGVIADWYGEVGVPADLAARFEAQPGVVSHGLFPPSMVTEVLVGKSSGHVERIRG